MIEINLLPKELRKRERVRLELPEIPNLGVYARILVIFFGVQLLVSLFAFYQRIEILGVRGHIASLKERNPEVLRWKSETAAIQNRLGQMAWMTKRKFYWSSLLNALSRSMTKGVWLRMLSTAEAPTPEGGRALKLEGSAIGQGQEAAYIGKFTKSLKENGFFGELFGQVELSDINQRKIKDFDVYDFNVVCVFKQDKG